MDFYLNLSIADLVNGLRELLAERGEALTLVDPDGAQQKLLAAALAGLEALPDALQALPLKELLALTDGEFDRDALVLAKLRELAELLGTPEGDAAAQVFAKLAPSGVTRRSYGDEAAHAYRQQQTPSANRALLERFTFPDASAPDAFKLAERFIQNGIKLDALMSGRAAQTDATGAGAARKQALEVLSELRRHVARAVGTDADLPRDLDDLIFQHLDGLERDARHKETNRKPVVVAAESMEPPPLPIG